MKKLVFIFGISFLVACNLKAETSIIPETETPVIVDEHTSANSLDWEGTYLGKLPCADCEALQLTLFLNYDESFEIISEYLGKGVINKEKGTLTWNDQGTIVFLTTTENNKYAFKVMEGRVQYLDQDGNEIDSPKEFNYQLIKQ